MTVHGGNIWRAAATYGGNPEEYVDFSSNINPLGTPPGVMDAMRRALDEVARYPEPHAESVAVALAAWFGLTPAHVVVGNGATELIDRLPLLPGVRRVVLVQPTFGEYLEAAVRWQRPVVTVRRDDDQGFLIGTRAESELRATARPGDLVFLCRPNNPTGGTEADEPFFNLLKALCENGATPVIDESFLGFASGYGSTVPLLSEGLPIIVALSFTKLYALPGLRLGCLLLSPKAAGAMTTLLTPWRVNCLAAAAGRALPGEQEHRATTMRATAAARTELVQALSGIRGIRPIPSDVNYVLLNIEGTGLSSSELQEALAERRLLVRETHSFPGLGGRFIRVAVRKPEENRRLVEAFDDVLRAKGANGS